MAEDPLKTTFDGSARTLFVIGELDIATAETLESAVDGALDGQGGELYLDLGGLDFIDSSGALAVVYAHIKTACLGGRLVILSPAPVVRRVLELMGLNRGMDVRDGTPPPRRMPA